jgi:hypothetical protein
MYNGFERGTEFLVVCTQSCNLVSSNFQGNPLVEVLVAKPVMRYNDRSLEATGRNVRVFHMQVDGDSVVRALACDVVRRGFLPRRLLLNCQPSNLVPPKKAARSFAGWMSRYYGRTAFPNELVRRAKGAGRPFTIIEQALGQLGPSGSPLHEGVQFIYVHLSTDDELQDGDSRHYDVHMRFLCREPEIVDKLDQILILGLAEYDKGAIKDGLSFSYVPELTSQTSVADLDGYERFPEWDHLSGLEDARETYSSPVPET